MQKTALSWVCFVVVVLAALVWRSSGLTFDSLWLDEGYQSIVDAYGQPLPNLLARPAEPFVFKPGVPSSPRRMLQNFRSVDPLTPPLYQLLLNRWITWFGGSDVAVRSLSVIISTLSTAAVFWLARRLFGLRCGLLAGLIQAFSPFDVYYGQEVRMYALVELAAVIACGSLILYLWERQAGRLKQAWRLGIHAVGNWALINSHYTGLFLVVYEVLLGTVVSLCGGGARGGRREATALDPSAARGGRREATVFIGLLAAWIAIAVLWLPWFPLFLQAAALRTASFYVARQPTWWWPITALFFRIPANWIVFLSGKQVVGVALPLFVTSTLLLLLVPLVLLAPRMMARFLPRRMPLDWRRQNVFVLVLLGWAIVPALGLWFLDVKENHRVIEISRYLMFTAPAIYILAAFGLSRLRWRHSFLPWILIGAQLFFAGVNNIAHATVVHQREPWRQMAQLVDAVVRPNEPLIVSQYYDILCLDRYLKQPHLQIGASSNTITAQLQPLLQNAPSFALVTAQEGDRIVQAVPANYYVTGRWDLGHSLHLLLYAKR